jgi:hypothetical protein
VFAAPQLLLELSCNLLIHRSPIWVFFHFQPAETRFPFPANGKASFRHKQGKSMNTPLLSAFIHLQRLPHRMATNKILCLNFFIAYHNHSCLLYCIMPAHYPVIFCSAAKVITGFLTPVKVKPSGFCKKSSSSPHLVDF